MMQLIGNRIRELRRKRSWSQEQLGNLVGFSQSKISKIERGDWDSLSDLRLIARALVSRDAKKEYSVSQRENGVLTRIQKSSGYSPVA